MASSIAAITTGSGGIVSTGDSSGNLSLLSGTTTIVAVTSAGVSVTGTLTASGTTTLTTPILGTPTSGTLTNCTGLPALSTASGSAPSYSARAWVNFNGTGTVAIRASGNVSSITDNGTGDYTVNFTTAMSDANYTVHAQLAETTGQTETTPVLSQTTSNFRVVQDRNGTGMIDSSLCRLAIFR